MKFVKESVFVLCLFISGSLYSKTIEYIEDPYAMQAAPEMVALAEKVAAMVDFKDGYEVVAPKKAGIQMNPWNTFTGYGINPTTKNPFIVINSEWLTKMPDDQQSFILARNFSLLRYGAASTVMKLVPFIFMLIGIMLIILLVWLLGKTPLSKQKRWIRILAAFGIVLVLDTTLFDMLAAKINVSLKAKHNAIINERIIQKTGRDAAIKAFEYFDASIKKEIAGGEIFFAPYEHAFGNAAQSLKKVE
jgi:hypothetical protein